MKVPRVSLEQWRTLQAVVDYGGFAQAAEKLHRSQSSVSYAIHRLEELLGVQVLEIHGRKAQLTNAGEVLLLRSRNLTQDASELEGLADHLQQGREAEIRMVVDSAFPTQVLMDTLKQFAPICQGTRIRFNEVILSGVDDLIEAGEADIAIGYHVPAKLLGEELIQIEFVAVAHPTHPLHQLQRPLVTDDLKKEMQVVISDSGLHHKQDVGWLNTEQRWSVSSMSTALQLVSNGMGYSWLPQHVICDALKKGNLAPLPLREGQVYRVMLYLIFTQQAYAGPATQQLADLLRQNVQGFTQTGD